MKLPRKAILLLLFPLAFLIFLGGDFAYPVRGSYSDLAISHYPNAIFLRQSIADGELPLWSPLLFAGYPFAANPLSGLHYPPGWFALLFPLPFGFNLSAALHLVVAGLGMFCFLRNEGLDDWSSVIGAFVFQAMPKLISHYAAGHLTLVYAVSLTPWLLWSEQKSIISRQPKFLTRIVLPGVMLGMIILADLRWAPYAGMLWLAFSLKNSLFGHVRDGLAMVLSWFARLILRLGLALFISACLWLPLLEYVSLSTRSAMTIADRVGISLPLANLLGFFIPSLGGYAEWEAYAGALPWLLLVFTLAVPELRRRAWFWLTVLGASILSSLGDALPGYSALTGLPGFSLLRVPSRALFLSGFSFAVLTGYALNHLSKEKIEQKPEPVFFMVPFAAFTMLTAAGLGLFLGGYSLPFIWAGVAMAVSIGLILTFEKKWLPTLPILLLIGLFLFVEMAAVNLNSVQKKSSSEVLGSQEDLLAYLTNNSSNPYRVYSPSFSLPQTVTAQAKIDLVDGIDPMQLSAYVRLFSRASGIPVNGYTVTLPPFTGGDPKSDNINYVPNPSILGILNVRYVLSAFPLDVENLVLVRKFDDVFIFENQLFRERTWVENDQGEDRGAELIEYSGNRIVINAEGPGTLVLADVNYPGWVVFVDGAEQPIQAYMGVLRSVSLTEGNHTIIFTFRPILVYTAWVVSIIAWIVIILATVLKIGRSKNE